MSGPSTGQGWVLAHALLVGGEGGGRSTDDGQSVALPDHAVHVGPDGRVVTVGPSAAVLQALPDAIPVVEWREPPSRPGTDLPPHAEVDGTSATVREMELLVAAGMTPSAVVAAATSEAASWLGLAGQVGVLVPGAWADLVLLDGDPLVEVSALRSTHAVVKGGTVVRDDRALLAGAR